MMRNLSSTAAPSADLRHRQQARRDYDFRWGTELADDSLNCGLDLSIHRPNSPSSMLPITCLGGSADDYIYNRFDSLASPPPAHTREREFYVSNSRRRTRNSRGTKEAKKRRDARRNRRKLAAQFLDEQLSKDIDETLNKAHVRAPPPVTLPAPTPILPTNSFWRPQPQQSTALTTRRTPSPFQLPPLDFNSFDLHDFPLLASPKQSPPLSPAPFCVGVPNWCPQIPAITRNGTWSSGWPKFFDLSHLPERKPSPRQETRCQELQLWQGDVQISQKKQSRFFPRQPSPKPTVKLPSTACTLHHSEQHAQAPVATVADEPQVLPRPRSISDAVEKILAAVVADAELSPNEEPTAVNLWNILSDELHKRRSAHAGERASSWESETDATGGVPLYTMPGETSLPAELDGTEIPYTHANSLTGYANEVAELHSSSCHEDLIPADSAIYLAEAISHMDDSPTGYELSAMPWPLTPASMAPDTSDPFVAYADIVEPVTNTDSDDIADSIAHYTSEQQLFEIKLPAQQDPTEASCDLDTFLSMGHVENCWCRDCEEEPELVNDDWATPLTESEGWMMWEDEVSANPAVDAPVTDDSWRNQDDGSHETWTTGYDWDDFYPSLTPQSPGVDFEEAFLGYYDDGPVFERKSEDYDWMWAS